MAYGIKTGGNKKGWRAPHTIESQEIRKRFIARVHEELDAILDPQIAKAKKGDTMAAKYLTDNVLPRLTENKNENTEVKTYKLDDKETNKIADQIVALQKKRSKNEKADVGTNTGRD